MLEDGQKAPAFCLKDMNDNLVCLDDFKGKWLVIYFYPKDNTSGCTLEAVDFTKASTQFQKLNVSILGISPDSVKSHCNFIEKNSLSIPLFSDPEHQTIEAYNAWVLKKMYGREYLGVGRSTFIIGPDGSIAKIWRKVKVKEHVSDVLKSVEALINKNNVD